MTTEQSEKTDFIGSAEPQIFGTIEKDDHNIIMVSKNKYKEYEYLDLRQYYKDKEGNFLPSKSGFTLPIDELDQIDELITVLQKAKEQLENG